MDTHTLKPFWVMILLALILTQATAAATGTSNTGLPNWVIAAGVLGLLLLVVVLLVIWWLSRGWKRKYDVVFILNNPLAEGAFGVDGVGHQDPNCLDRIEYTLTPIKEGEEYTPETAEQVKIWVLKDALKKYRWEQLDSIYKCPVYLFQEGFIQLPGTVMTPVMTPLNIINWDLLMEEREQNAILQSANNRLVRVFDRLKADKIIDEKLIKELFASTKPKTTRRMDEMEIGGEGLDDENY